MMIDWKAVETMSPEEIENVRVECIKELQTMEDMHQIIKDEFLRLDKEVHILEGQKKDARISLGKSAHNIKSKKNDMHILETRFWQKRR